MENVNASFPMPRCMLVNIYSSNIISKLNSTVCSLCHKAYDPKKQLKMCHCLNKMFPPNISNIIPLLLTTYFLATLNLVNGLDQCSGRVEVFHSGRWGPICNNNWGIREATMVCKEIQCGAPKTSQEDNFGQSGMRGFTSSCSGNVSSITQCDLRESGTCDGVSLSCAGKTQEIDKCGSTALE